MIWRWERRGRSPRAVATLALVWGAFTGLWLILDIGTVFIALSAVATLPLLRDILLDRTTAIVITPDALKWITGRQQGMIALDPGTRVSLRRRFDGGLRIVITSPLGQETRLPPDLSPPLEPMEAALRQTQAKVQRDPFRLF